MSELFDFETDLTAQTTDWLLSQRRETAKMLGLLTALGLKNSAYYAQVLSYNDNIQSEIDNRG